MSWFGWDYKHQENSSRLTRIETMMEERGRNAAEVMKEFGAMREKLGTLHDDMVRINQQLTMLPGRIQLLEDHKNNMEALRNRIYGAAAVIGVPVTGISAWTLFEKIGHLISK